MKKILVVDDSALMRRVLKDILSEDSRFELSMTAKDGKEALDLVLTKKFDAILLDINMPRMDGIEFLKELKNRNIKQRVLVVSSDTVDGAEITMNALGLGAIDVIQKPENVLDSKQPEYKQTFLEILDAVCNANIQDDYLKKNSNQKDDSISKANKSKIDNSGKKIVAIASSTGGPKALQRVIPYLPANLDAPVLVVQHMPVGFTSSLADRLNTLSNVVVSEAKEGEMLEKGHVYIAKGGVHMNYDSERNCIHYTDEPHREGVKPCANYMYESLINSKFEHIECVVLTGMGADGTVGIKALNDKCKNKKIHIIAQNEESCVVYGMPKNIVATGLVNSIVDLDSVAKEIIMNVGVR